MNALIHHLETSRQRLSLERYGLRGRMSYVLVTPRFRASSHVVFLVLGDEGPDPVLVAKIPRLPHATTGIKREATILQAVQEAKPGGFDSLPRVVALEQIHGHRVLIETALAGRAMDPRTVRWRGAECCHRIIQWLTEVACALGSRAANGDDEWWERVIERPLDPLLYAFPLSLPEQRMAQRAWDQITALHGCSIPAVIEHGDLSSPNVMLLKSGKVGVVDWELAELHGLPLCDLLFFLTYVAFARRRARATHHYVSAFHSAFFARKAWARPYVARYAQRVGLELETLTPLFVLCWMRYLAGLLMRLNHSSEPEAPISDHLQSWLRQNRYYALWQHTMECLADLDWEDVP